MICDEVCRRELGLEEEEKEEETGRAGEEILYSSNRMSCISVIIV